MSTESIVRVRVFAADPRALRRAVRRQELDLCHGSVINTPTDSAVDAFVAADRVADIRAGLAADGARLDVLGTATPEVPPAVGQGDRFAQGDLPRGAASRKGAAWRT